MSENNKQEKIYVPGTSIKEFKFDGGGSVIRIGLNLEKFAPFVKQHKNERGYINFNLSLRKEVGPYGDTHSLSLDTYTPKAKPEGSPELKNKSTKPIEKKLTPKKEIPAPEPEEDFV